MHVQTLVSDRLSLTSDFFFDTVLIFSLSSADVKSRKEKLEQVACFSLFGNVMSMASVQLVGANRDALLLSFKDAKVPESRLIVLLILNSQLSFFRFL